MNPEPAAKELETQALTLPEKARAVHIVDQAGYDSAGEMLHGVVALRKKIEGYWKPLKAKAHEAHSALTAAEKEMLNPVEQAEAILKGETARYYREQERLALERRRIQQSELAHSIEEERLRNAIEAESQGATVDEVSAVLDMPAPMPAMPRLPPPVRAVRGITPPTQGWIAECFDIKLLCRAVAEGKASPELVQANETVLNTLARSLKGTLAIPGVRAVPRDTVSVRQR